MLQYDLHAYAFGGGQYNTIATHKGTFEFSFCRYKKKQYRKSINVDILRIFCLVLILTQQSAPYMRARTILHVRLAFTHHKADGNNKKYVEREPAPFAMRCRQAEFVFPFRRRCSPCGVNMCKPCCCSCSRPRCSLLHAIQSLRPRL